MRVDGYIKYEFSKFDGMPLERQKCFKSKFKFVRSFVTNNLNQVFIVLLFCFTTFHFFANEDNEFYKYFSVRDIDRVERLAEEQDKKFKETGLIEYKYKAQLAKAMVANLSGNSTEGLRILVRLLEQCPDCETRFMAWVRYHISANLSSTNAPKLSQEFALPVVQWKVELNDDHLMNVLIDLVAFNYFAQHDYDKALIYYKRSLKRYKKEGNRLMTASMLNNIGLCYLNQKKFAEAEKTFKKSMLELESNKKLTKDEEIFRNIVSGNLGTAYDSLGNYSLAEKYLNEEIEFYLKNRDQSFMLIGSFSELMKLYMKEKKINEADALVSKLEVTFGSILEHEISGNEKPTLLQIVYDYYLFRGDEEKALKYSSELIKRQEEYASFIQNRTSEMNEILYRNQLRSLKNEVKAQKIENEYNENRSRAIFWILLLVTVIALGSFGFYFVVNSQMKKTLTKDRLIAEQKAEILSNKSELLEQDVRLQQEKINNLAINLNLKKETEKTFLSKILELKRKKNVDTEQVLKDLQISISNLMSVDKKGIFQNIETDEILKQFKLNLKKLHPNLSKSDLDYCCYFRLGMSAKEIGAISGQSDGSIRVLKNKIKNKMALDADQSLNDYLKELNESVNA